MNVEFRARIKGNGVKTPDFLAGGVFWEVKSPTSDKLKVIEKRLREAVHQSRDIIFDSRRMRKLSDKQIHDEVVKWAHNLHHGYCPDSCANSSRRLPAVGMVTRPAATRPDTASIPTRCRPRT
ncbi:hypothetical protein [Adlercreutzia equolifaciens]|uniref:CdiA C-terminal domain-containing protein n=1 Tax=Adlercreutzia equolifaciens TaxID=446660 RepID=UPI0037427F2A